MAISQLPNFLERSIKAQIKVTISAIYIWLLEIFILHWVYRNSNKHVFCRNYAKATYFLKPTIFGRSSPKSICFLREHIQIYMQNFKTISATSFELSRDEKLTTYEHTHSQTDTHTYIHFRQTTYFQCRPYKQRKWRNLTIDFWDRFNTSLNQRLTKQNRQFLADHRQNQ